jgi:4-oxalocrotonate tautomerase
MPHVIVKMLSGRSEQQKTRLAAEFTKVLESVIGASSDSVSIAIEDVKSGEWTEKVYKQDILSNMGSLYKKPGYDPM